MAERYEYKSASHWNDLLIAEFGKESDRAAVILVASLFDNALESLLRTTLVPSASNTDEVFDTPNAPLGTFSGKISMANRIGLISPRFCRDLHLIRRIRNEFAHNVSGCTFDSGPVNSRCLELAKSSGFIDRHQKTRAREFPDGTRGNFLIIASWMLYSLNSKVENAVAIPPAEPEWGYDEELDENSYTDDPSEEAT